MNVFLLEHGTVSKAFLCWSKVLEICRVDTALCNKTLRPLYLHLLTLYRMYNLTDYVSVGFLKYAYLRQLAYSFKSITISNKLVEDLAANPPIQLNLDGVSFIRFDLCSTKSLPFLETVLKTTSLKLTQIELHSPFIDDSTLEIIALHCPEMQILDLSGCEQVTDDGVLQIFKHCKKLHLINLDDCNLTETFTVLSATPEFYAESLTTMTLNCDQLKRHYVNSPRCISQSDVTCDNSSSKMYGNLLHLNTSEIPLNSYTVREIIAKNCQRLQSFECVLDIDTFKGADYAIIELIKACRDLLSLVVKSNGFHFGRREHCGTNNKLSGTPIIDEICATLPNIRTLQLPQLYAYTDDDVVWLTTCCHELKSFVLPASMGVTSVSVLHVSVYCRQLCNITLLYNNFNNITMASICQLLNHCTLLTHIKLMGFTTQHLTEIFSKQTHSTELLPLLNTLYLTISMSAHHDDFTFLLNLSTLKTLHSLSVIFTHFMRDNWGGGHGHNANNGTNTNGHSSNRMKSKQHWGWGTQKWRKANCKHYYSIDDIVSTTDCCPLAVIVGECINLHKLEIESYNELTNNCVEYITLYCKKIQYLSVASCPVITSLCLCSISKHLLYLNRLDLFMCKIAPYELNVLFIHNKDLRVGLHDPLKRYQQVNLE